tara:strand:+ start:1308 stop:2267 length:960 start_codon:yes stop_codon:yes gene_type:complete
MRNFIKKAIRRLIPAELKIAIKKILPTQFIPSALPNKQDPFRKYFYYPILHFYYDLAYYKKIRSKKFKRGRVFDCIMFSNETDMLELRLNELNSVVDHFVIVEGTKTFRNNNRETVFEEFSKKLPQDIFKKIRYVKVNDSPDSDNPWVIEYHQRRQIMQGLYDIKDNDYIWISDVDEIPNKNKVWEFGSFDQHYTYYYFNALKNFKLQCTTGLIGKQLIKNPDPQFLRDNRFHYGFVKDGGWHFSFALTSEKIIEKIKSYAHEEFDLPMYTDESKMTERIKKLDDIFDRKNEDLYVKPFGSWLPETIYNNHDKYKKWIL